MNEATKLIDDPVRYFDFLTERYSSDIAAREVRRLRDRRIQSDDLILFKIDEITFEEDIPRQEALENVLASLRISGINVVYLILGSKDGVNFYFGLSRCLDEDSDISIRNLGESILKPSMEGNFRGSKVVELSNEEKARIIDKLLSSSDKLHYSAIDGVPGINKDEAKKNFQGVDRLVDTMLGDAFGFMVISHPVCTPQDLQEMENNLYLIYDKMSSTAKQSLQVGSNLTQQKGSGKTVGKGSSVQEGYSSSDSTNVGRNDGTNYSEGTNRGTNNNRSDGYSPGSGGKNWNKSSGESSGTSETATESHGTSYGSSKSNTHNISHSSNSNESFNTNEGTQKGTSQTVSLEITHKKMQEWMKYFDEVVLPRLDYGRGKGLFISSSLLWAENDKVLRKLENTATSLFAGEQGNRVPLTVCRFEKECRRLDALRAFQLPVSREGLLKGTSEWEREIIWSRRFMSEKDTPERSGANFYLGNWMSVKELAVMAGIPQKEVVGLKLKEEVEFGLNTAKGNSGAKQIELGKMVVSGNEKEIPVHILHEDLDRHIFVTGVTGAGKTTTCQNILIDSGLPFLIIEPAKTEYRILLDKFPDMEIFTIGSNDAQFRVNPFELFEGESISSRVDMIKASIEAAFDMEAAIPQLIEASIYESYLKKGWNISNDKNPKYADPFAPGTDAFPTLSDVLQNVSEVVEKQGFDIRLKSDYIGSIKARLQSLTLGAKGIMLDCARSIDFDELLDMRVVLELENLRDSGEKSLVIGFVMVNLCEAIRRRFKKQGGKKHAHITLIEEAHRLLSKPQAGDSNRLHGVETFTDMLAEIRKYGESLIIADQIPNKLTPEVLKNTNTKIVHRLFAQDDKDAIGSAMALTEEQRNFLSNLETGRAVVFNGNWHKPVQAQIKKGSNTSAERVISDEELHKRNLCFYSKRWQKGIINFSHLVGREPSEQEMEVLLLLANNADYKNALVELVEREDKELVKPLFELFDMFPLDKEKLAAFLGNLYFRDSTSGNFICEGMDCYKKNREAPLQIKKYFEKLK